MIFDTHTHLNVEQFKDEITNEQHAARARIFDGLDPHVQDRFQAYSERAEEAFTSFERMFMSITRYELKDKADFQDEHVFNLHSAPNGAEDGLYFYKTERIPHARQFKYSGDLAEYVRSNAKNTETPPAKITFSLAESSRVTSDVKKLRGKNGTMRVEKVTFPMQTGTTDMSESYIVAVGQTDSGQELDTEACHNILELAANSVQKQQIIISDTLDDFFNKQIEQKHQEVKSRNTDTYLDKKDLLERQYKDRIVEYEMKVDKLESRVREKQKLERQTSDASERLKIASEVQVLRKKARNLNREKYDMEDNMDDEITEKITLAKQATEGQLETEKLFEIEWRIV